MKRIGVDNGTTGSVAVIEDGKLLYAEPIPIFETIDYNTSKIKKIHRIDYQKVYNLFKTFNNSKVYIERPIKNPMFFNTSVLAARAFEATLIAIEEAGLPYEVIDSKKWQKIILPGVKDRKTLKLAAKEKCRQLYKYNEDKDVYDAILIAHWAYITYK